MPPICPSMNLLFETDFWLALNKRFCVWAIYCSAMRSWDLTQASVKSYFGLDGRCPRRPSSSTRETELRCVSTLLARSQRLLKKPSLFWLGVQAKTRIIALGKFSRELVRFEDISCPHLVDHLIQVFAESQFLTKFFPCTKWRITSDGTCLHEPLVLL